MPLCFPSMQESLTVLVPRVWPFLRHTISSVRKAALETLFTLLSKAEQVCVCVCAHARHCVVQNNSNATTGLQCF